MALAPRLTPGRGCYDLTMVDHRIEYSLPTIELGRKDVKFLVFIDDEKQGELHISEGGLDWWPRGAKSNKRTKSWAQLRAFMESQDVI